MVEKMEDMKDILLKMKEETLKEINKAMKSGSETPTGEPSGDIYDQASSERDRELDLLLGDREQVQFPVPLAGRLVVDVSARLAGRRLRARFHCLVYFLEGLLFHLEEDVLHIFHFFNHSAHSVVFAGT